MRRLFDMGPDVIALAELDEAAAEGGEVADAETALDDRPGHPAHRDVRGR